MNATPSTSVATARRPLPPYHALQAAFHRTFEPQLRDLVAQLPCSAGALVLDGPCGDGFYAALLASQLGPGSRLVAVDASPSCVALARRRLRSPPAGVQVEVFEADVYRLPYSDETFDLAWCAESMVSLDDPEAALAELARVTRVGGTVAVLEADEFHHVLLPWPVELELAIHQAQQEASRLRYGDRGRLAAARHIRRMLLAAGLRPLRRMTFAADRYAPFPPREADFLTRYLRSLGETVGPHLSAEERVAFEAATAAEGPESFFQRSDTEMTCLNVLHLAHKRRNRPCRGGMEGTMSGAATRN